MSKMKKDYVCKFCGRTIVTEYGVRRINFLPTLIDHLIIRHRDKLDEIGSIYLSDIPVTCYEIKTEEMKYGNMPTGSSAKTGSENSFMYTDFA